MGGGGFGVADFLNLGGFGNLPVGSFGSGWDPGDVLEGRIVVEAGVVEVVEVAEGFEGPDRPFVVDEGALQEPGLDQCTGQFGRTLLLLHTVDARVGRIDAHLHLHSSQDAPKSRLSAALGPDTHPFAVTGCQRIPAAGGDLGAGSGSSFLPGAQQIPVVRVVGEQSSGRCSDDGDQVAAHQYY